MERIQVSSSNLASIGFDADTETLEIEFLSGKVYRYYNVPEHVHTELMGAGSHGVYFSENIRNAYPYEEA